ncbi:MAG: MXAN_5808 family serine peptidase [Deltaproteobacteria bacterium]|nr:MXAN_5808 family serine peptidase [Deltaproteobacteria bacterium]
MPRPLKKFIFLPLLLSLAALSTPRVQTESLFPASELKIFDRAMHFVKTNYVNPKDVDPKKMLQGSLRELTKAIRPFVFQLSDKKLHLSIGSETKDLSLPKELSLETVSSLLSQSVSFLANHKPPIDNKEWEHLAIQGAMDTLDPHSNFLPPKVFNEFRIGTKGNFGGLGIVVGIRGDGELTVIAPLEGTPAWKIGIKPKDKIIQIGDESTVNMPLSEAVEKLRGKIGTPVSLTIHREGVSENLTFRLTRALIKIQSVNASLIDKEHRIGLLKIKNFQEETLSELERHLSLLKQQAGGLKGLVLDLRNNPGGLLDQAVSIADRFLAKGSIVITVGGGQNEEGQEYAKPGNPEEDLPIVILVNEGSASASEIIAGALKNLDRATVLGNPTFGKGSVQTIYDLRDGSALKLTIAKYLTPGHIPVQSIGITPDIILDAATVSENRTDIIENEIKREKDLNSREEETPALFVHPVMRIRYLDKEKKKEEGEEDEGVGQVNLQDDLPVEIAKQILMASSSLSRQDQIKNSLSILNTIKEREEKKISEALEKAGLDWSVTASKEKPSSEVYLELLDEKGANEKELTPGKESKIRVTVENKGRGPFNQLMAVMHSEDPFFKNHEFVFGKINPKEKKSWSIDLKVPDLLVPREVPVQISFFEARNNPPKEFKTTLKVAPVQPPLYSFSTHFFEDGHYSSQGNGDHKIQKGERISLVVTVKNRGNGSSEKPLINLKNPKGEGFFIEKGRVKLSPLLPGQEQKAILQFHLEPQSASSVYDLELEIIDGKTGQGFSKKLRLDLEAPLEATNESRFTIAPSIALENMPLQTTSSTVELAGTVTDDELAKSLLIFVGDDKVYYKENTTSSPGFHFNTKVNLKKGINTITLSAEDDKELSSRRQWILWKK